MLEFLFLHFSRWLFSLLIMVMILYYKIMIVLDGFKSVWSCNTV